MRIPLRYGLAACVAAIVALGVSGHGQTPVLALVGVHVIPMDRERILERQTLVIRDGHISAMGAAGSVTPTR